MSGQKAAKQRIRRMLIRRLFVMVLLLVQIVVIFLTVSYYTQLRWVWNLFTVLGVLTALHLLTHDQPPAFKISLVFLILLFPVFGGVFYWVFHFQTTTVGFRKRLHRIEERTRPAFAHLATGGGGGLPAAAGIRAACPLPALHAGLSGLPEHRYRIFCHRRGV